MIPISTSFLSLLFLACAEGTVRLAEDRPEVEVSPEFLQQIRSFLEQHPEPEVASYYRGQIDARLAPAEEGG